MSSVLATASPPAATISPTTCWAGPVEAPSPLTVPPRSLTTTFAPSAASVIASARPMPPPAPVTTATRPSFSPMGRTLLPVLSLGRLLTQAAERVRIVRSVHGPVALHRERLRQTQPLAARVQAQHLPHRGLGRDVARECDGARHQLVMRDDVVDEPDAQRFVGVDEVAGDRHLARL